METKIYTVAELKNLFLQELLNKTDGKISKVSDHSVLNGMAFGSSKVFQKSMKDVALLESELFPEYASGEYLDKIAMRYGISPRQKNLGSSVYVRIVARPNSLYSAKTCKFISTDGFTFVLVDDFIVKENGWGYALLRSVDTGSSTNVQANSIVKVVGQPVGHKFVTNELPAYGGIEVESDEDFLQRILQNFNNFSFETLDKLTFVFQTVNPTVLAVRKIGQNTWGQTVLGVITINGSKLTNAELQKLALKALPYLSLQNLPVVNGLPGSLLPISVQNIEYEYIDLDFRVEFEAGTDVEDFKTSCQRSIIDFLDFTEKDYTTVQWEDLYALIKTQKGVKAISETTFFSGNYNKWTESQPHFDVAIPSTKIARLRMFVVRGVDGTVIVDNKEELVPYYYSPTQTNLFSQINNSILK